MFEMAKCISRRPEWAGSLSRLNRTLFLMLIDSASRAASHCPGKLNLSASSNRAYPVVSPTYYRWCIVNARYHKVFQLRQPQCLVPQGAPVCIKLPSNLLYVVGRGSNRISTL